MSGSSSVRPVQKKWPKKNNFIHASNISLTRNVPPSVVRIRNKYFWRPYTSPQLHTQVRYKLVT
jgi:hypothetical protein